MRTITEGEVSYGEVRPSKNTYLKFHLVYFNIVLEDTACYAGLLPATAEGFGLRPRLFLPFRQNKSLLYCFGPFLAFFGLQ